MATTSKFSSVLQLTDLDDFITPSLVTSFQWKFVKDFILKFEIPILVGMY